MMSALKLSENTIAKTSRVPGVTSSLRTANRRKTDRLSRRFKAVGSEGLSNGVARHQRSSGF